MVHVFSLKCLTAATATSSRALLGRVQLFSSIKTFAFGDTTSIRQIKSEWIKLRLHIYTDIVNASFMGEEAWQPPNMNQIRILMTLMFVVE